MFETRRVFVDKPWWKIYYVRLDENGKETDFKGVYHKEFIGRDEALLVAKQRYRDPCWKYIVSKTNPFLEENCALVKMLKEIEKAISQIHFATLDMRSNRDIGYELREEKHIDKIKSLVNALREEAETLEWFINH